MIKKLWHELGLTKLKNIYRVNLSLVMWELCKRRNSRRHIKEMSYESLLQQTQIAVHRLAKVKYPWVDIPECRGILIVLRGYKTKVYLLVVK